jgi:hypothetical protein
MIELPLSIAATASVAVMNLAMLDSSTAKIFAA